ncbi:MAG: hypothetical protein KJ964_10490 [Verrucomicrobia bacterium]|nr:hypothetical protein [Verrucomicrobiota bacterium]MBU1735245.1 hypothetical protein [Verrucomicrobiota bacterium]MBU1857617.1 hypothetical protein [Verrucomicrobiota bacterium]
MLTIYLKAVFAVFRQTMGDLWGVLWRPRHTLQEIYERGTWFVSLVLLLVIGYIGMPLILTFWVPFHNKMIISTNSGCLFGFLFLFGFLVTLATRIKSHAKTGEAPCEAKNAISPNGESHGFLAKQGQWYSFLRIAGYCMLPEILLTGFIFILLKNILQHPLILQFLGTYLGYIFLLSISFPFLFLTLRLLTIMLNIVCPAMRSWRRLVTVLVAFLGGNIIASVCISVLNMLYILWKG